MHPALWFLAIAFAALLALWPVALVAVAGRHALARRWRRVGQVAWLLPVWMIAASIGLTQLAPVLKALDTGAPLQRPLLAGLALVVALCCAGLAWALLVAAAKPPAGEPAASQR
jgi:hypothetical protein